MAIGVFHEEPARGAGGKDNLFVWTVFLLVLVGVAFACWLGSFYVFGHPEEPKSYGILKKLGKLPPPTRFQVTKAPAGEFLDAQRLFERYSKFTALQLERENQIYLRNYIKNYTETKKLVPYVTGKYAILKVYELHESDFFNTGVVALTQSVDFPQVLLELIYTAPAENVGDLRAMLKPGVEVRLDRTLDLSAVVHVARAVDGRVQLSVVPLLYGQYRLKDGVGEFSLEPPSQLSVASGLPLIRTEEVRSVFREQAELRKRRPSGGAPAGDLLGSELVRADPPKDAPPLSSDSDHGPQTVAQTVAPTAGVAPSGVSGVGASKAAPEAASPSADVLGASALMIPDGFVPLKVQIASPVMAAMDKPSSPSSVSSTVPAAQDVKPDAKQTAKGKDPSKDPLWSKELATSALPSGGVVAGTSSSSKAGKVPAVALPVEKGAEVNAETIRSLAKNEAAAAKPAALPDLKEQFAAAAGYTRPNTPPAQGAVSGAAPILPSSGAVARPVVVATPSLTSVSQSATWKTYAAGRQPNGKSVSAEQALALQGRNDGTPNYLRGRFVVTAVDRNRAVMRQESPDQKAPPARVIVEYPPGALPPSQGSAVSREDGRGFEIREVRRGADGQVNIFVREVIAP
jgi:hypothetical protein